MAALYKEGCKQQPGKQADIMVNFAKQFVWTNAMVRGHSEGSQPNKMKGGRW